MRLLGAVLGAVCALPVCAQQITSAAFSDPTARYAHGILGDAIEWGGVQMDVAGQGRVTLSLPQDHVFEDVTPRLWDVTGDGQPEVVVIETDMAKGAALAVYGAQGKIAETPHIGRSNRWLAPIGAVDLDGDGTIEIAYIDRPHLAKVLRVWRFEDGDLTHVADLQGYTNHKIGESDIAGGIRACNGAPEMIVAAADWTRLAAVRFGPDGFSVRDIGPHRGRASFAAALACDD
jgi:hypothetical protein